MANLSEPTAAERVELADRLGEKLHALNQQMVDVDHRLAKGERKVVAGLASVAAASCVQWRRPAAVSGIAAMTSRSPPAWQSIRVASVVTTTSPDVSETFLLARPVRDMAAQKVPAPLRANPSAHPQSHSMTARTTREAIIPSL